jgi:hypothetical protein
MAELKRLQVQKRSTISPIVWDGSVIPMLDMESITITCTVAPSVPRAIKGGPAFDTQRPRFAIFFPEDGSPPVLASSVAAIGIYKMMQGQQWVSLAAGDGTIFISAASL